MDLPFFLTLFLRLKMRLLLKLILGGLFFFNPPAEAFTPLDDLGLDLSFQQKIFTEFKSMGYPQDIYVIDFDDPTLNLKHLSSYSQNATLFSLVQNYGSKTRCAIGIKRSNALRSPEHIMIVAAQSLGAHPHDMWRIMFRHEMGHCALAFSSHTPTMPDPFIAEPFADVFALEWTKLFGGVDPKASDIFVQTRRRLGGYSAHATWPVLSQWLSSPSESSPCRAAWHASPLDSRSAVEVCPP